MVTACVRSGRMRMLIALLTAFAVAYAPEAALGSQPALQPGVHVDPGSPAGKEYQIPITAARGQVAGGSSSNSANPPLFGVGVTPPPSGPSSSGVAAHARHSAGAGSLGSRHTGGRSRSSPSNAPVSGAGSEASDRLSSAAPAGSSSSAPGGSGWIALVAGGLLVLVLGGGGGLAIRQRALRG